MEDFFFKKNFTTKTVNIGKVQVGGNNPVRIQSMTDTDTLDVIKTSEQIIRLADAGCEIARMTVQSKAQAYACEKIKNYLLAKGYDIPLVADIHFYPMAAIIVADFVEKIRINPGNYAEKRALFQFNNLDENIYKKELEIVEEKFFPLIEKLKKNKVALRIGVNHGSLSDRIMSRYGNTVSGMVHSAIEYTKICRKHKFHDILFSMKSSSTKVMIDAYRSLVKEMIKLKWDYPLHLGVTEAGSAEDGRIKSAIGIGSLLADGIGDTIRVSLTEDPTKEIKPAKEIITACKRYNDFDYKPAVSIDKKPLSLVASHYENSQKKPDFLVEGNKIKTKDGALDIFSINDNLENKKKYVLTVNSSDDWNKIVNKVPEYIFFQPQVNCIFQTRKFISFLKEKNINIPVILYVKYPVKASTLIEASIDYGSLLVDNLIDVLFIDSNEGVKLSFDILQACGLRHSKTEFISCPGCGRTLFNLQKATKEIKKVVPNIPGLKIAIMGCIVNGPGEMQDADFGYVGAGKDKVDLYVQKKCIMKNISAQKALKELLLLINKRTTN